ncbi:MAG: GPR endopeptidase [Oscillospiraceae bacterium]|nr:GPR endopeptidase [Oscillospiraceae bacterium]
MIFRSDLAVETMEYSGDDPKGVEYTKEQAGEITIERVTVKSDKAARNLKKQKGTYVTVELPPLTDNFKNTDTRVQNIGAEIGKLLPELGLVLVVGLGNAQITPDSLGPRTIKKVLATRHINGELAKSAGLDKLRPVAVLATGVTGQTGIETGEYVESLTKKVRPSAIIAIDALASRKLERLGTTLQISDTGIAPGGGVGNHRTKITAETMGVPVIAIGVPTVVDAATLAFDLLNISEETRSEVIANSVTPDGRQMVVTPKEVDLLVDRAARLIAMAVNFALHKEIDPEDIAVMMG